MRVKQCIALVTIYYNCLVSSNVSKIQKLEMGNCRKQALKMGRDGVPYQYEIELDIYGKLQEVGNLYETGKLQE